MIDSYISQTIGYLPQPYERANLSISFRIGSGQFTEDAVGNLVENYGFIIISATVSKISERFVQEVGEIDQKILKLKGRLTSHLPTQINDESIGIAVLTDADGVETRGVWRFIPVVQNRNSTYLLARNRYIQGTFTINYKKDGYTPGISLPQSVAGVNQQYFGGFSGEI